MCRNTATRKWPVFCLVIVLLHAAAAGCVYAQAGLRESLERLDRNGNGEISPDEITSLSRPYLERISKARGMSLDRPNPIDKLQEAARIYFALQNGVAGNRIMPEGDNGVKSFGPEPDQPLVPEFGLAEVKYPYLQADLDEADRTLRRSDRNKDGFIDREEARHAEWTHRDPFEMDLDGDDRLSRMELTQRYARRRLLAGASTELIRKAVRTGSGIRPSRPADQQRQDDSQWWRRGGSSYWLTASLMGRFDTNRNGRLELQESQQLGIPPGEIDVDRDGELTRDEVHAYLKQLQEAAGDLTEGLPGWFYELDADRDGQVAMNEFATEWTDEKLQEFGLLDTNGDGLLTAAEILLAKPAVGGTYRNDKAVILPPRQTIISEIEIDESYLVGDLNVQVSITHTHTAFLDGYLTGPDGQRIELFAEVGGEGDNFDGTIFDDQAREPIVKARPPFQGTFLPSGVIKRQPGLSHFHGKNVQGIWQLVIRASRSERFGMLHNWALIVKPQETMLDAPTVESAANSTPNDRSPPADSGVPERESESVAGKAKPWGPEPGKSWDGKTEKLASGQPGNDQLESPKQLAEVKLQAMGDRIMQMADKNGDGVLTIDEYSGKDRQHFSTADANGDGQVDKTELNTAMQRLLEAKSK